MRVTTKDISTGIVKWIEQDMIPKGTLFQQGVVTFLLLQGKPRLDSMLSSLALLSDNGEFDLDELDINLHEALAKMGGKYTLPIINYTIDSDDLDLIVQHIKGL